MVSRFLKFLFYLGRLERICSFRACSDRRRIGTSALELFHSGFHFVSEHVLIEEGLGLFYRRCGG